ncbi:MAG: hypothetical protein FWG80_05055, partial [Alphaproteobacteria bacterium]|nr:hypothetical protein [Alphaproteobacteria bacterium]
MSLRVAAPLAVTDEAIFPGIPCHCEWSKTAKQSFQAFRVIASGRRPRSNLFKHFVSLRVVEDREAIFSNRGSIIIPLPEKIASSA